MPSIAYLPRMVPLTTAAGLYPNAKAYWTITGSSTSKDTYSDYGLTIPNANPTIADTNGVFPTTFLATDVRYRLTLTDQYGTQIYVQDDLGATISATDIGAALYPRSAAEIANNITPTAYQYPYGHVLRYGADPNGVASSTTAFTSACLVSTAVYAPNGTYLLTNVPVTASNVLIYGDGWNSILKVGANNSTLFIVTGQNFSIQNTQWQGDGTTSSSNNGVGVRLTDAGGAIFQDNFSTGFGFGAISGTASASFAGPKIVRHKCRGTVNAAGNDFYFGGIWTDTLIQDVDAQSATAGRVLVLYDNSTTGWQGLTVRGGVSSGYVLQQWTITDEHLDGSNRVWTAVFDGVRCIGSNWSGIKCKTSRNVKIVNCTFDGCGLAQEDAPSGLYGDVLVNSLGKVTITGNTFRNSGSAAIKVNATLLALYPIANPGGLAEDLWTISGNQIDTTGVLFPSTGYGVVVANGWKGMLIHSNVMRGLSTTGILNISTAASPFWDLGVFNNTITDSPTSSSAMISLSFGQSLRMDGNLIQNCGATGVILSDIPEVSIGSTDMVLDPAAGAGRGYQIGNTQNLIFKARAGNSTYTQWAITTAYTLGTRIFNGANAYECVVAGTSGAGAGPVATSGADTSDGTVTWYFVGKYQLMPYALRLVGTSNLRVDVDVDWSGCITGPFEILTLGASTRGATLRFRSYVQTTGAAAVAAWSIPMPDAVAWQVEMRTAANANAVPDRAAYYLIGCFYRTGGGNVTLQGALTVVSSIESNAAWDATLAAVTTNLRQNVTGAAATTVNWNSDIVMRAMP